MSKLSRRDFLRVAALGAGAAALNKFLAACSPGAVNPTAVPASLVPKATRLVLTNAPATSAKLLLLRRLLHQSQQALQVCRT